MVDAPDVHTHEPIAKYTDPIGRYLIIYFCLLVLAALQFVIAFSHAGTPAKFERMLLIAIAEAGLALAFFMHLWAEKRGFMLFVILFTGFWWPCNTVGRTVLEWKWALRTRSLKSGWYRSESKDRIDPDIPTACVRTACISCSYISATRFFSGLRTLLHSSCVFRRKNDRSIEKWHPYTGSSSYSRIHRDGVFSAS